MTGYPHMPVWVVLGTTLLAIVGFINHVRFVRAGAGSFWARRYFDAESSREFRNLPFAQLPLAVMFAMWAVASAYTWISGNETWDALMGLFLFASFPFGAVGVKRLFAPPERAKPRWLREEERRRGTSGPA